MTSTIDVSGIDATKPVAGTPTTASVRDNFSAIKTQIATAGSEISTLQSSAASLSATKANAGANSDITSLSGLTTPLSIVQGGTAGATVAAARANLGVNAPAFDNLLINGEMSSMVVGSASVGDDTYSGPDLWYMLTQSGNVTPSQIALNENGTPYSLKINQDNGTAQREGFAQIIEASRSQQFRGETLTLTARMKTSSGTQAIRYAVLEWTGTADAVTSDVVNDWTSATYTAGNFFLGSNLNVLGVGSTTPSTSWGDMPALTVTVGSSCNNLIVFFWTEATAAQNHQDFYSRIALRKTSVAVAWQPLPAQVVSDLVRRYVRYTSGTNKFIGFGYCISTTNAVAARFLDVNMRAVPSLTVSAAGDMKVYPANVVLTAITVNSFSTSDLLVFDLTAAAGLTANGGLGLATNNTGSPTFLLDARL